MNLSVDGIKKIAEFADKSKNVKLMFLCQILLELREIKEILEKSNYSDNGSDDCTDGAYDGANKND